jgi:hypothetical protein
MATDQVNFLTEASLRSQHGIGIKLRQQKIQSCQLGHAGLGGVHSFQHCAAYLSGVGVFSLGYEFERQVREARRTRAGAPTPHNPDQGYVDAVGGSATHDACYDHSFTTTEFAIMG